VGNQTHGFDGIFEIDSASLLAALENLVTAPAAMRLGSLDLSVLLPSPAPPNTVQHGALKLLSQPGSSLALPGDGTAVLTISFPTTLLQLDAVPAAGVGALAPTTAGPLTVTVDVDFGTAAGAGVTAVTITPGSLAVAPPDVSALGLSASLSQVVEKAIQDAAGYALASLFPITLPVELGGAGACDIGPRSLSVKLLPGGPGVQPALAFLLTLQDGSQGDPNAVIQSNLAEGVSGAFLISNPFLETLLCCLLQITPGITGLPAPTSQDDDGLCCHWRRIDHVDFGTVSVRVDELDVCIVPGDAGAPAAITFHLLASQHGTGWDAYAQVDLDIALQLAPPLLVPVVTTLPTTKTWTHVSPWVWVLVGIGAVIGAIVGGPPGALAGGTIGLVLSGLAYVVLDAIGSAAANVVAGAIGSVPQDLKGTQVLPGPISDNFGRISDLTVLDFDDLMVGGRVQSPASNNVLHEGSDIVLNLGDRIDLDRGVIQRAGESVAGFTLEGDLAWLPEHPTSVMAAPAPSTDSPHRLVRIIPGGLEGWGPIAFGGYISPLRTARLVGVGGASFWSLTEGALSALTFPATVVTIDDSALPVSDTSYPSNARVFAVRTTEGRRAKCVAWRDSVNRLHLSYVTYTTPVPLAIASRWTSTRGPLVYSLGLFDVYQVARRGTFTAISRGFPWWPPFGSTPQYQWFWNDQPLDSSGVLSDGTTSYVNLGARLIVETAMGTRLRGVLQVEQVGTTLVATVDVDESGTERVSTVLVHPEAMPPPSMPPAPSPTPVPPPLIEQLPAAFARGMGVPVETVRFS
jgi:hypothetical protein